MDLTAKPTPADEEFVQRIRGIWNNFRLKLDLPLIDLQHIWLIALVVRLERTEAALDARPDHGQGDAGSRIFQQVLQEALDYAVHHFSLEEKLLERMEFPGLEPHAARHKQFILGLNKHAEEFRSGKSGMARKLLTTLKQWLYQHIAKDDQDYYDYLRNQDRDARAVCQAVLEEGLTEIRPEQQELYYKVIRPAEWEADTLERRAMLKLVSDVWYHYNLHIGLPIVDMQHLWLIQQVVQLDYAIHHEYEERRERFNAALSDAISYIQEHFSTEEKIMEHFEYKHFEEHRQQHRRFVQFVQKRNEQYKAGDEKAIFGLLHDLKEWLISHIAVEDKKLFFYFQNRRPEVLGFCKQAVEEGDFIIRRGFLKLYKAIVQEGPVTDPDEDDGSKDSEVVQDSGVME